MAAFCPGEAVDMHAMSAAFARMRLPHLSSAMVTAAERMAMRSLTQWAQVLVWYSTTLAPTRDLARSRMKGQVGAGIGTGSGTGGMTMV